MIDLEAKAADRGKDILVPTPSPSSNAASETNRKRSSSDLPALDAGLKRHKETIEEKLNQAPSRHLDGVLSRVTNELYVYRDQNLTYFSEDNRGLKEEFAKLKEVDEKLDAANKKVLEEKQQLKRLTAADKEVKESKKRAEAAKARDVRFRPKLRS